MRYGGSFSAFFYSIAIGVLFSFCPADNAAHATPAYTISNNTTSDILANPPFTLGFEFATTTSIIVTGLGIYDSGQDGLVDSYPIGIWDSTGTLIATATVSSGTVDPLINQFRYASISAVLLSPGDYRIGALFTTGDDPVNFPGDATGFSSAADITFIESAFAGGGTLADPVSSVSNGPGYFGPNFTFVVAVAEPGSLLLFTTALSGFGVMWCRRTKSVRGRARLKFAFAL